MITSTKISEKLAEFGTEIAAIHGDIAAVRRDIAMLTEQTQSQLSSINDSIAAFMTMTQYQPVAQSASSLQSDPVLHVVTPVAVAPNQSAFLRISDNSTHDSVLQKHLRTFDLQAVAPHLLIKNDKRRTHNIPTLLTEHRSADPTIFDDIEAALKNPTCDILECYDKFVHALPTLDDNPGYVVIFLELAHLLSSAAQKEWGTFSKKAAAAPDHNAGRVSMRT